MTHYPQRSDHWVYAFGTALTDLNPAFDLRDTDSILGPANSRLRDFDGRTRISEVLRTFRERHRAEILGNRTIMLLITDGLDTGPPEVWEHETLWLNRPSCATVWLNPLLRYDRCEALAEGAKTLARHVDKMLAIHNLPHLNSLAAALAALMSQARCRPQFIERAEPRSARSLKCKEPENSAPQHNRRGLH